MRVDSLVSTLLHTIFSWKGQRTRQIRHKLDCSVMQLYSTSIKTDSQKILWRGQGIEPWHTCRAPSTTQNWCNALVSRMSPTTRRVTFKLLKTTAQSLTPFYLLITSGCTNTYEKLNYQIEHRHWRWYFYVSWLHSRTAQSSKQPKTCVEDFRKKMQYRLKSKLPTHNFWQLWKLESYQAVAKVSIVPGSDLENHSPQSACNDTVAAQSSWDLCPYSNVLNHTVTITWDTSSIKSWLRYTTENRFWKSSLNNLVFFKTLSAVRSSP